MINKLSTLDTDFDNQLTSLITWETSANDEISYSVKKIIDDVIQNGDNSVLEYTMKFDSLKAKSISELIISKEKIKQSFNNLEKKQKDALLVAADRIKSYQFCQGSWR